MLNVVQLFRASVVRNPQHPCLQFKEDGQYRTWTYGFVWEQVMKVAAGLKARGMGRGDKVAILAESSPNWVLCDFAVMAIGASVVPIYPSVTAPQAAFILKNADVKCLLAGSWDLVVDLVPLLPQSVSRVVLFEGEEVSSSVGVESMKHIIETADVSSFDERQIDDIPATSTATIVHTSGTSGTPKGVILSHQNLSSNIEACLSVLPVEPSDISLSYLPLSHIFERTVGHFCLFTAGATVAYAQGLDTIQANLQEVRPTVLVTVPRLLEKVYAGILQRLQEKPAFLARFVHACIEAPMGTWKSKVADRLVYRQLQRGLGGRIRAVVSGGAGLAADIASFYQKAGIPVCEGYGMTETAPVIAVNTLESIQPGTVGKPLPNLQIRIADDGELLVKGPNVMSGYYNNPQATSEVIDSDGWLHTGDIAELVDGRVRIVERKKNLLVLATGKNVAPYPIENAMTLSPYIVDTVLVGDQRKYVACLVAPDFAAIADKLGREGHSESDYPSWVSDLEVRRLLQREIQQSVTGFAEFEQPKRAVLLTAPFSIESGDLTPTLKVKSKVVLEKYQSEINQMYEGISFLDIFGDPETGLTGSVPPSPPDQITHVPNVPYSGVETAASAGTETNANIAADSMKSKRKKRRWGMWFGLALVAAVGVLIVLVGPPKLPANLNLLATLGQVKHNNAQIDKANNQIVGEMGKVQNLSGLSPKLATQLGTLSSGLHQQNNSLAELQNLSVDEIGLSKQFANLASTMNRNLGSVARTTKGQSDAAANMSQTAKQLSSTAANIANTNQQIASKLNDATAKTQTVASEVP